MMGTTFKMPKLSLPWSVEAFVEFCEWDDAHAAFHRERGVPAMTLAEQLDGLAARERVAAAGAPRTYRLWYRIQLELW